MILPELLFNLSTWRPKYVTRSKWHGQVMDLANANVRENAARLGLAGAMQMKWTGRHTDTIGLFTHINTYVILDFRIYICRLYKANYIIQSENYIHIYIYIHTFTCLSAPVFRYGRNAGNIYIYIHTYIYIYININIHIYIYL